MSGQNIAENSKKIDTLYLYDKCFLCDLHHLHAGATAVTLPGDSLKQEEVMNAVKSLKADWAIITLMIVVAVVMYGYLIPKYW
ncbi:small membrane protein YkgR [Klebsiella michiganensis]